MRLKDPSQINIRKNEMNQDVLDFVAEFAAKMGMTISGAASFILRDYRDKCYHKTSCDCNKNIE